MSKEQFSAADLQSFKAVQRLAYDALTHVEGQLHEGITERAAAKMIEAWLREHGVERFFHRGFAWFGDRSSFRGFSKMSGSPFKGFLDPHFGKQFQPSDRRLREGDAVILDVAPMLDDAAVDIGYACSLGPSEALHRARMALEPHRELILQMVRNGHTQQQIYRAVDELIEDQGYVNAHAFYPGSVLGHRVGKLPLRNLRLPNVGGFGLQALLYLTGHQVRSRFSGEKQPPLWNQHSDAPCEPGLWAVEPHIGRGDVGAKFEEILVVTEDDAWWLDDDLPHVRYWKAARA